MKTRARFYLLKHIDITSISHYDPISKNFTPIKNFMPATFAVTWPNGMPCSLVEVFLVHKFNRGSTAREDGGTIRATIAKLTHLIRHCWRTQRDFWELDDDDIGTLVAALTSETKENFPAVRARDNNTVRAIIASAVEFLLWIQNNLMIGLRLLGTGPEFRIRLIERKIHHRWNTKSSVQLVYHLLPPRDIKEPKRAISRDKRNALWSAVSNMAMKPAAPRWTSDRNFGDMLNLYLKARRELLLELLEATGARPGELARLRVSKNEDCDKSFRLYIMTLKRRRLAEREIPLQPGVAMRLTVFIKKHRKQLLNTIRLSGVELATNDRIFLSINGEPTSERVMESEFNRISKMAGLGDYQCCMSMFRHRFITKQVAIHLQIYAQAENKAREMMTNSDYRTILKKVATITGHGSELSLLHYIDLAWDELGVGAQLDQAVAIDASIESTITQVISMIGTLEHPHSQSAMKILLETRDILVNMKQDLTDAARNIHKK